ncbi:MAG: PQQ-dependent sugar dehydrogenase [Desulfobulbaceae bacterium]|nr:PQQ-dependent sugar dehydrogenase [Desulfobulbaceae bacterium]
MLLVPLLLITPPTGCPALTLQPQILTVDGFTVRLMVPEGMRVEFLAPMERPRFLVVGPHFELLAGSAGSAVYRLEWPYTTAVVLVSLPGRNHSVAFREGMLYVAETAGLHGAPYTGLPTSLRPGDFSLITPLPSQTGGHWSRTVVTGPDGRLYIGIGISGNCSDEYLDDSYDFERRRGGVYVLDESGAAPVLRPYSSGLRNPIGLAFYPSTTILYATNAGPDNLGFDLPPEIFVPLHQGSYHGMPWFQYYDGAFHDGECAPTPPPRPASDAVAPPVTFDARSTPQGVEFFTDARLSPEFKGNGLVAIHGSWAVAPGGGDDSRRPPKIVMVRFAGNQPVGVENVVTGFQRPDGSRFARPSGVIQGPDGNLYFTSDGGEVTGLFKLSRTTGPNGSNPPVSPANSLLLKEER